MISPASVVKLSRYFGDPAFDSVMRDLEASLDEAEDVDLDVSKVEPDAVRDLVIALEALGYDTTYDEAEEMIYVIIP